MPVFNFDFHKPRTNLDMGAACSGIFTRHPTSLELHDMHQRPALGGAPSTSPIIGVWSDVIFAEGFETLAQCF